MASPYPIIYTPHPIFRQKATMVETVNDEVREIIARMFATLRAEKAVGLGANMVGVLQRIIVVSVNDETYAMVNPELTWRSDEMQTFDEASISFPGIDAKVTRPRAIKVSYLDENGGQQSLEAEGFLATVIQHEMDYLDGRIFLDYVSKMKREMLLKKSAKHLKMYPPHVHTEHCHH